MQNHQENSILNDSISIVKQINNTSEEIFTVSSFLQNIHQKLSSDIQEIFQKNNIPFIYQ